MNLNQIMQLANQFKQAPNKKQMLNSMVNPQQQEQVNQFQNLNKEQQAQRIADKCNELGISKEQLQGIISSLR